MMFEIVVWFIIVLIALLICCSAYLYKSTDYDKTEEEWEKELKEREMLKFNIGDRVRPNANSPYRYDKGLSGIIVEFTKSYILVRFDQSVTESNSDDGTDLTYYANELESAE